MFMMRTIISVSQTIAVEKAAKSPISVGKREKGILVQNNITCFCLESKIELEN